MTDSVVLRAAVVASLFIVPASLGAQSVETRIERAAEGIEGARADNLDIIAPRLFERAEDRLADARRRYDEGAAIDDIGRRIDEAVAALDEAEKLAPVGRTVLGDALAARADALRVSAPEFAEEDWERAERTARDAGRRIEDDDRVGAGDKAERAESEYRDAELNAIRADVLGRTRAERDAALELKADKRSPILFAGADSLVDAAEAVLSGDRYQASGAGALAEEAAEAYRHAAFLAALTDSVSRKHLTVETVALREEEQVRRIAEALLFEARFTEGTAPVVDDVLVAIESLYEERAALREDVEQRAAEISRLDRSVDSLDARLAELELREAAASAELRERRRREQQFREVEAIFIPAEGEVLRSEGRLILRLAGLTFPSGSSEIRPDNFALLTKVQRVVREFPEARVVVEGHTDSQGNESMNQDLSRRRAIAVREYLLSNIAMSADRITAVGYGESRPVAPNNSEAGRSRNRRIEITLAFDGT
jgi:outer membrane protein OmpA-like peptidoglycan-associated protein